MEEKRMQKADDAKKGEKGAESTRRNDGQVCSAAAAAWTWALPTPFWGTLHSFYGLPVGR